MKCFFVTAIKNIEIPGDLGRGDKLTKTTFITNNISAIDSYITPEFERVAGVLETKFIRNARAVVYGIDECPDDISPDSYVLEKLGIVVSFLHKLWFLKDNAVTNELGLGICESSRERIVHSNQRMVKWCTSLGESPTTGIFT